MLAQSESVTDTAYSMTCPPCVHRSTIGPSPTTGRSLGGIKMKPRMRDAVRVILIAAAILWPGVRAVASDEYVPPRAIAIEGGLIAAQAGVMNDPNRPPLPFGKLKYPTIHFVILANETAAPIWAEVEIRVPDRKPTKDFGGIGPGKSGHWQWPGFGTVFDQPIPVRISIYADERRARSLAEYETTIYFDGAHKADLFSPHKAPSGAVAVGLITGWHEMNESLCDFAGTLAEDTLRRDICHRLWKLESVKHRDCEHPVTGVEPLEPDASALLKAQPEDFRGRADAFRAKGDLILEKWTVKSCEAVTAYEVMMIKAPQGGTDFLVGTVQP